MSPASRKEALKILSGKRRFYFILATKNNHSNKFKQVLIISELRRKTPRFQPICLFEQKTGDNTLTIK